VPEHVHVSNYNASSTLGLYVREQQSVNYWSDDDDDDDDDDEHV